MGKDMSYGTIEGEKTCNHCDSSMYSEQGQIIGSWCKNCGCINLGGSYRMPNIISDFDYSHYMDLIKKFNDKHDVPAVHQGLVLSEETGELCEEVLKTEGGKLFKDNSNPDVKKEVGDVIYTASTIGDIIGIDPLEAAMEVARDNNIREDN